MFQVIDIYEDAKRIVGFCDELRLFNWISDAVALIANKGQFDPYIGFLDICVNYDLANDNYYITLPREVGSILGVTICGNPAIGRNELFAFHLNGPGERRRAINWAWDDRGLVCTMRDLAAPRKLVATIQRPEDEQCELIVYGYDTNGPVRQQRNGVWEDGWQVPVIYGYPVAGDDAPVFIRITRVRKSITTGVVKLWAIDADANAGLIAQYEPDEVEPVYRRIRLSRAADWVRVAYRKPNPRIRSLYERIPLRSRLGLLLALKAVKAYSENDLATAQGYEATAARLETEAQMAYENPGVGPLQVVELGNSIHDSRDLIIN